MSEEVTARYVLSISPTRDNSLNPAINTNVISIAIIRELAV
jgi:hypothetical protein